MKARQPGVSEVPKELYWSLGLCLRAICQSKQRHVYRMRLVAAKITQHEPALVCRLGLSRRKHPMVAGVAIPERWGHKVTTAQVSTLIILEHTGEVPLEDGETWPVASFCWFYSRNPGQIPRRVGIVAGFPALRFYAWCPCGFP